MRKLSYKLSLVNSRQFSCNSCSRLTRTRELRKLSYKLSLVNSHATLVLDVTFPRLQPEPDEGFFLLIPCLGTPKFKSSGSSSSSIALNSSSNLKEMKKGWRKLKTFIRVELPSWEICLRQHRTNIKKRKITFSNFVSLCQDFFQSVELFPPCHHQQTILFRKHPVLSVTLQETRTKISKY